MGVRSRRRAPRLARSVPMAIRWRVGDTLTGAPCYLERGLPWAELAAAGARGGHPVSPGLSLGAAVPKDKQRHRFRNRGAYEPERAQKLKLSAKPTIPSSWKICSHLRREMTNRLEWLII
jgi:hypothetical protein